MYKFLFAFFTFILIISSYNLKAQKEYKAACIAYYNLENLFDTIDEQDVNDFEFTPLGPNQWNSKRYLHKIDNMSKVIAQIGDEFSMNGPSILGVSEIENKSVLIDLVNHPNLKDLNYGIIHYNSPDRRGIDVALLYKKDIFTVYNTESVRLHIEGKDDFRTRDQLVVSGVLDSDTLHFIVNHWPSRSGGEKRSRPLRNAAAQLSRSIADSLFALNPNAKIIVLGDLNDDPTNQSLVKYLKAKPSSDNLDKKELFNPMYAMYKKGNGSLAYRDSWNLFDQIVISEAIVNDTIGYKYFTTKIFRKKFMFEQDGRYKGYPLRTFAGGVYKGGFSDHFPVYLLLIKEK